MLKQVYEINENNYLKEIKTVEFDEQGNCKEELAENIITTDIPQGLYCAKWNGTEWISTMTEAEYIATLPKIPQEPTTEERLIAVEEVILNLL